MSTNLCVRQSALKGMDVPKYLVWRTLKEIITVLIKVKYIHTMYMNIQAGSLHLLFTIFIYRTFRHIAYRRFTRWIWQLLRKRQRKCLPACAVTKIRERYPSQQYCGFRYPDWWNVSNWTDGHAQPQCLPLPYVVFTVTVDMVCTYHRLLWTVVPHHRIGGPLCEEWLPPSARRRNLQ